jgi:hypothetical protein
MLTRPEAIAMFGTCLLITHEFVVAKAYGLSSDECYVTFHSLTRTPDLDPGMWRRPTALRAMFRRRVCRLTPPSNSHINLEVSTRVGRCSANCRAYLKGAFTTRQS